MEAVPHAGHIVAQAGLTFAVLVAAFDARPAMGQLGQARQRGRRGQTAPIELGLTLLLRQRALAMSQPSGPVWSACPRRTCRALNCLVTVPYYPCAK